MPICCWGWKDVPTSTDCRLVVEPRERALGRACAEPEVLDLDRRGTGAGLSAACRSYICCALMLGGCAGTTRTH
jgi:hypothetical protein